jgi:hypothetical protein
LPSEALGRSALLSIARPTSINDNDSLLLVRVTIGGASRLVLVGLGRPVADRITTVVELPRNGDERRFTAGRALFLKVDAAAFVFAMCSV